MTSKEFKEKIENSPTILNRHMLLVDDEVLSIINDLKILEAIKNKAQNNRFFKGCLLRMFCEIKKTPDGAFTKKEKIKDEYYETIKEWLDDK